MIDVARLKNDIKAYTDAHGLIHVNKIVSGETGGDGNLLLYTGFYYSLLRYQGALTQVDAENARRAIDACRHKDYPLLWRSPEKQNADDNQNADDYWAALPAGLFCLSTFPVAFYAHMSKYSWSADIQQPTKFNYRYCFARFSGFIAMSKVCAGIPIGLLEVIALSLKILCAGKSPDALMRLYSTLVACRGRSQIVDFLGERYLSQCRALNTSILLKQFFGEHPLCVEL